MIQENFPLYEQPFQDFPLAYALCMKITAQAKYYHKNKARINKQTAKRNKILLRVGRYSLKNKLISPDVLLFLSVGKMPKNKL